MAKNKMAATDDHMTQAINLHEEKNTDFFFQKSALKSH